MPFAFATVRDGPSYGGQFLALAGLLALIGVVAARSATRQARATRPGAARRGWTGLAAVAVGGTTVWAAHLIDVVGWCPAATGSFDPAGAALSLSVAVAAAVGGLAVAGSGPTGPARVATGAALFGTGAWTADVVGPGAMALAGASHPRPLAALPALAPALGAALISLLVVLRGAGGGWATVGVVVSAGAWTATHLMAAASGAPRAAGGGPRLTSVSSTYGLVLVAVVLLAVAVVMAIIVGAVTDDRARAPAQPRTARRQLAPAHRPPDRAVLEGPRFPARLGRSAPEPSGVPARSAVPARYAVPAREPVPFPARYFEMDTVELPTTAGPAARPSTGGPRRGGRRWYRIRPYADHRYR